MSEISQLLREHSESLQEKLVKQSEQESLFEQTQLAAAESLVEQGIDPEEAADLVKSAEELTDLSPTPVSVDPNFVLTILEKSASYIDELEQTIQELQTKITNSEGFSKAAAISGPEADNLHELGFSDDQVKIMADNGLLEKVAHLAGTPWEPGSSSGRPTAESLDPIERFCFGR